MHIMLCLCYLLVMFLITRRWSETILLLILLSLSVDSERKILTCERKSHKKIMLAGWTQKMNFTHK